MAIPSAPSNPVSASLGLTPGGIVICQDPAHPLHASFSKSEPAALIALGGHPAPPSSDAPVRVWKSIADTFIRALCQLPDGDSLPADFPRPDSAQLTTWTLDAPPMPGAEEYRRQFRAD
jgi:non-specific serine/threonine protein kinase